MPQLPRDVVKERAGRLRERGARALRATLDREVGALRRVLTESPGTARTEQFFPVKLAEPLEPGKIFELRMTGHDGRHLLAA